MTATADSVLSMGLKDQSNPTEVSGSFAAVIFILLVSYPKGKIFIYGRSKNN